MSSAGVAPLAAPYYGVQWRNVSAERGVKSDVLGALIDRRFRVLAGAGRGGFGTVHRAFDARTGREVALKVLHATAVDQRRFEREAETLATMSHPNVVGYVAHGITDEGASYLAMEWLEGCDLASRLVAGPLSESDALRVGLRAAQGLAAAHEQGVLHRDIKPSNLFLVDEQPDKVKVLDFGIAGRHDGTSPLTRTGTVLGTPAYMAPEQARGQRELTPRADVFSLGCVLFECLAGTPAFEGDSAHAVLALVLSGITPELTQRRPGTSPALASLLSRMMAFDPTDRYADAALAALAISDVLTGATSGVHEVGRPAVGRRAARSVTKLIVQAAGGAASAADRARLAGAEIEHEGAAGLVVGFKDDNAAMAAGNAARLALELIREDASLYARLITARDQTPSTEPGSLLEAPSPGRAGTIALDDATATLLGREFVLRREDSGAWLVASRESVAGAIVGRTRELALLDGLFAEVDGEHCARLALVVGEAGIGKSHLIQAAVSRLATSTSRPRVLWARADRPTRTSPFALLRQLVRHALPEAERGPDASRRHVVERLVAERWVRADAELLCELAAVPGEGDEAILGAARRDPLVMASGIRSAWLAFMSAQLGSGPLVLAIEDLHFADSASVRLLDVALAELAEERLLALVSARPEEAATEIAMLEARRPEMIRLQALRSTVAAELVRALLPSSDPALTSRILERGAGHPLRLVQLARLVQEGGSLDAPGDAAIDARLARLDPNVQRVLRAASVLGTQFSAGAVAHLLGGAAHCADLKTRLDAAIVARLITPVSRGEDGFQFSHGLVQEAAYALLRDEDRKSAHAAAADWWSQRAGSDPSLVAWHFDRAGARDRALAWYDAAARAALAGADLARALELTAKALECEPSGQALASVLLMRAEAAWAGGDTAGGKSAAQQALEVARPGSLLWLNAAGTLITSAGQRGDNDAVATLVNAVLAQPCEPGALGGFVVSLCRAATQLVTAGQRELAEAIRAHVQNAKPDDPQAQAWLAYLHVPFHVFDLDYERAVRAGGESARLHAVAGDARMSAYVRNFKAGCQIFAGDFVGALEELDVVDAVARRAGADLVARWARYTRAKVACFSGDPGAARVLLQRVHSELKGNPRIIAGAHVHGAIAALRAGDAAWAEQEAGAARAVHSLPGISAAALAAQALARVLAGRSAEALTAAREASAIVASSGPMSENEALVHLALPEALAAHGEQDEARQTAEGAAQRLLGIAAKLSERSAREAYLYGIHTHARTMQLASRLGLHVDIP